MSDIGRGGAGGADEDRLPWLEPVEDVDQDEGIAAGRLVAGIVAALVAIGLVVGGIFWLRDRTGGGGPDGAPGTITADATPYKVKPGEPGGMKVEGQGDSAYATSEGADPNAAIDLSALPEQPAAKTAPAAAPAATPPASAKTAPVPVPPAQTRLADAAQQPKPAAPAPKPAATPPGPAAALPSGPAIQLGAFSSEAKANAAWKSLSGRFAFLAGLQSQVVPATVGSGTVYRLRAAGAGASDACGKLKVAGETCLSIGK